MPIRLSPHRLAPTRISHCTILLIALNTSSRRQRQKLDASSRSEHQIVAPGVSRGTASHNNPSPLQRATEAVDHRPSTRLPAHPPRLPGLILSRLAGVRPAGEILGPTAEGSHGYRPKLTVTDAQ